MKTIPSANPLIRMVSALLRFKYYLLSFLCLLGFFALSGSPDDVQVAVATQDLVAGTTITEPMVRALTMPRRTVPAGAVLYGEFSSNRQVLVGKVCTRDVYAGEPFMKKATSEGTGTIASRLAQGQVALELRVEALISPPPNLEVADTIAVYAYDRDAKSVSTSVDGVSVVAVTYVADTSAGRSGGRQVRSLTLAVNEEQGKRLTMELGKGSRLEVVVKPRSK